MNKIFKRVGVSVLAALSTMTLAAGTATLLPWNVEPTTLVKAEVADGVINITKNFNTGVAYDQSWKNDPDVFAYEGTLTGTNEGTALGCGKQDSTSTGEGWVAYKVEVPEGNVIKTLNYTANGRAFHSSGNADCSAGNCVCGYAVSISIDGGVTYKQVSTESIVTSGSSRTFSYDLTGLAADKSSVIVKLYMSGKSWSWVSMTDLAITGTYAEGVATTTQAGKFSYENGEYAMARVFDTMTAYDNSFLNDDAVYDNSGNLTISPDGAYGLGVGKQNTSSSGSGHISYLVEAPENDVLKTGKLNFRGRVYHSTSDSECNAGTCSCEFIVSVSTDGGATYQTVKEEPVITESGIKDFEYDFSDLIKESRTAIVKIYMSGKAWNWIHIKNLAISGTYGESETPVDPDAPDMRTGTVKDDFCTTSVGNSNVYKAVGVGGVGNASHGLVPGPWGGDVTIADDSYIIYKIEEPGVNLSTLSLTYNARIWNQDDTTSAEETCVIVSAGTTETNLTEINKQGASSIAAADHTVDLTDVAAGNGTVYVKIQLVNSKAIGDVQSLAMLAVKLFNVNFTYTYDAKTKVELENFNLSYDADKMQAEGENDNLKFGTISGSNYAWVDGGYTASGIYTISADELKAFYTLQANMKVRVTSYNDNSAADAFKVFASTDKSNWTELLSLSTDTNWATTSATVDFTPVAKGANTIYVKVVIAWPDGNNSSRDWIAFGQTEFKGTVADRTNFNITYNNVEGATNENPTSYDKGTQLTLVEPVKANYNFGGWYTDAACEQAFAGITAATVGNIQLYAKWVPVNKTITLNANGGAFGDQTTATVQIPYGSTISRNQLPANPTSDKTFIGWFKDEACTVAWVFEGDYGTADVVTEDTVLYAKFGKEVKVTYVYADDATADLVQIYEEGEVAIEVVATREGYVFDGWYNGDVKYDFSAQLVNDVTLTAKWYKIYAITYNGVEGVENSNPETYTVADDAIILADVSKTGYTFNGWYNGDTKVESIDCAGAQDIILTASFTENTYTLTIEADENSFVDTTDTTIGYEGKSFVAKANDGYRVVLVTVNGTSVAVDGEGKFTVAKIDGDVIIGVVSAERYVFGGSVNVQFNATEDIFANVYDAYNVKKYPDAGERQGWLTTSDHSKAGYIVYAVNVGSNKSINTASLQGTARVFTYDNSIAQMTVSISFDGVTYKVLKDYPSTTSGSVNTAIELDLTAEVKGKSQVFVKYEIASGNYDWVALDSVQLNVTLATAKVTFKDDIKVITSNEQTIGAKITLIDTPTKNGYTFLGWYTDKNLTTSLDENLVISEAIELYAKWTANNYVITYETDGGDFGDNVESYTILDTITLAPATKDNHKFLGWYLTDDFSGDPITAITAGNAGDITLYAKYLAGEQIVYVLNGGENNIANPSYYYTDETTELLDPTKEGATFAGWYLDEACTELVSEISEGATGTITLYAKWVEGLPVASDSNVPSSDSASASDSEKAGCFASVTTLALPAITMLCAALYVGVKGKKED